MRSWCIIASAVLAACFAVAPTNASNAEAELVRHLFDKYMTTIRPVANYNDSVTAKVRLTLLGIDEVDLDAGLMDVQAWIKMTWTDANLRWNKSDYGGIEVIRVPSENVWKPDVTIYNGHDVEIETTMILVYHNGMVMWVPPVSSTVMCKFNALWYPFDQQTCIIQLGSWTYDAGKIDVRIADEAEDEDNMDKNSDWRLISLEHKHFERKYNCCEELYSVVEVHVGMKRRSCHFVREEVIPMLTMVALGLFTMIVPATRADLRLLVLTLLIGSSLVHINLSEAPSALTSLSILNAQMVIVLIGLFICNCVQLSILRGHSGTLSLLSKLTSIVAKSKSGGDEKSCETLISNDELRCQRTVDVVFTVPLIFVAIEAITLFMGVPLF